MRRSATLYLTGILAMLCASWVAVLIALEGRGIPLSQHLRLFLILMTALAAVACVAVVMVGLPLRRERVARRNLVAAMDARRPEAVPEDPPELARSVRDLLAALKRAEDEAAHSAGTSDRAERLAAIGRLASGLAHEIRNPITNVIGFAALARERCADESLRKDLATIEEEARRCEAITDSILAFSRTPKIVAEPVDLPELLEAGGGLPVAVECDVHARRVMADRTLLRRVFDNLVKNAADAGARSVAVRIRRDGGFARVTLRDDGSGIPVAMLERLFDPFSTSKTGGLGLGLAISRGIVSAHGGQLTARNHPEGGAEFEVVIPVKGIGARP
jgi:signal transduction histidine kinase